MQTIQVGLIGLGAFVFKKASDKRHDAASSAARQADAAREAEAAAAPPPVALAELQEEVPKLDPAAPYSPKGGTILNTFNPSASQQEAQIVVDATDAEGRCHDQGVAGLASAPAGVG